MNRRKFLTFGAAAVAAAPFISVLDWNPTPAAAAGVRLVDTVKFGAYATDEPYPDAQSHYNLEAKVGPLNQMSWFVNFSANFPKAAIEAKARGKELLIAWMPILNGGVAVKFSEILAGRYDAYITQFITQAKAYGYPVTLRFAHEMNLGKLVWSVGKGGPTSTDEFIAVWKYIYAIKQRLAATNVSMAWCISNADLDLANPAERYWPGAAVVDKMGFDTYSGWDGRPLTTPTKLIKPNYDRLTALSPVLPILICELGCRATTAGEAYTKSQWYTDLFAMTGMPNLTNIYFFSKSKEQDWRLDSSPEVTTTVRNLLATRPNP